MSIRGDFFEIMNMFFSVQDNDVAVDQMKKLLKADTRSCSEVIKEIEKIGKNKHTDAKHSDRILRK